jgi:hypothetical protein
MPVQPGIHISRIINTILRWSSEEQQGMWSFVTKIFHDGQPSHGGYGNIFESDDFNFIKWNLGSVASLLAATLKEILIGTTSSGILYQLRDI